MLLWDVATGILLYSHVTGAMILHRHFEISFCTNSGQGGGIKLLFATQYKIQLLEFESENNECKVVDIPVQSTAALASCQQVVLL